MSSGKQRQPTLFMSIQTGPLIAMPRSLRAWDLTEGMPKLAAWVASTGVV
jgi:hypothetical protein